MLSIMIYLSTLPISLLLASSMVSASVVHQPQAHSMPRGIQNTRLNPRTAKEQSRLVAKRADNQASASPSGNSTIKACANLAPNLNDTIVNGIKANLAANSNISDVWVSGTRTEALLELDYAGLSVFSPGYLGSIKSGKQIPQEPNDIAKYWLSQAAPNDTQFVTIPGGGAADPASLGVAFINAALTNHTDKAAYQTYISRELVYLLQDLPRLANGAISQRSEVAQAWSDFVYMVPPFLAYAGIQSNNISLAQQAYTQISLYRELLNDAAFNVWYHILYGYFVDAGFYAQGEAWVLAGIVRTYATYVNSPVASKFKSELTDLECWANELIDGVYSSINTTSNLFPNYFEAYNQFDDSASSALIASATYRMAQLGILANETVHIAQAEKIRAAVYADINPSTYWLASTTSPYNFTGTAPESPESMAFILLLEAASRDYACSA